MNQKKFPQSRSKRQSHSTPSMQSIVRTSFNFFANTDEWKSSEKSNDLPSSEFAKILKEVRKIDCTQSPPRRSPQQMRIISTTTLVLYHIIIIIIIIIISIIIIIFITVIIIIIIRHVIIMLTVSLRRSFGLELDVLLHNARTYCPSIRQTVWCSVPRRVSGSQLQGFVHGFGRPAAAYCRIPWRFTAMDE